MPLVLARWIWAQTWIPLRLKKSAYKAIANRDGCPGAPFEINFHGLRYEGNLDNGIEFAMFFYGAFEKPLLYFLRDCFRKLGHDDGVFYDIGANIGQHSLFLSQYVRAVHAFEPLAEVSDRLRYHCRLNHIDNITLHQIGLGDSDTQLPFFAPTGSNQGTGSFSPESLARGNTPGQTLSVRTGSSYFSERQLPPPHVIKIDVEGFEKKVLAGMRPFLARHRPIIVLEVSYGDALSFHSRTELERLLPDHYELLVFDTRKPDGRTARRRGARAKRTGEYRLKSMIDWRKTDQDDLVAVPKELKPKLPMRGPLRG